MKDLKSNIKTAHCTVGTTIVDKQGYESLTFSVDVVDGTTVKLEHGDDSGLSDAADVGTDFIIGKLDFVTADGTPVTVGYNGDKRYVKISYVDTAPTGATQSILGHPHLAPTDQA